MSVHSKKSARIVTMLVDGRKIASDIAEELKAELVSVPKLKLLVIQVGADPATESFIRMKKAFADKVGIEVTIEKFLDTVTTAELVARVQKASADANVTGMIVQLPMPTSVSTREVLDTISPAKDPDLLSAESKTNFALGTSEILPPVVGAIAEVLARYYVDVTELSTVVVGYGSLVGEPVTVWLKNKGVDYALVTSQTGDKVKIIKAAELLITGAGDSGVIKPEMISIGVVIVDAGTSEHGGVMMGDCDPACATKAALMTPVPGGVGPIAVATLFRNLVLLSRRAAK